MYAKIKVIRVGYELWVTTYELYLYLLIFNKILKKMHQILLKNLKYNNNCVTYIKYVIISRIPRYVIY